MNQRILPEQSHTGLVTYTLKIDGEKLGKAYPILSIEVFREVNKVPYAEIYFRDGNAAKSDFPLSENYRFVPGSELEIFGGYNTKESLVFSGLITGFSIKSRQNQPSVLVVKAADKARKMAITPRSDIYYDISEADLFASLIRKHELTDIVEPTDIDTVQDEIVQFGATDWDFLVARAEANGKVVLANNGTISIQTPQLDQEPELTLTYGANIFDFTAELDARFQYGSVVAQSWHSGDQEVIETEQRLPNPKKEHGNIRSRDLAGLLTSEVLHLQHPGQMATRELHNWAKDRATRSLLAKTRGKVRLQGYPDIEIGQMVVLQGVGSRFNGPAFVSAVFHQFGDGNWWTTIGFGMDFAPFHRQRSISAAPAAGLLPAISGLQTGRVTQLQDDPTGQFRVLVNLPLVNEKADGIWARVSTLDAGAQRGSFFRPDLGDEVVIGFINDDPRDAIVLGGLHSTARPSPFTPEDTNHLKGFITRAGMHLLWDDDKKSISLKTPAGNVLEMDEEAGSVTLSDQYGNQLVMNENGIRLKSSSNLELEAQKDISLNGVNITNTATGRFKAEANTGATLKCSTTTTVEGKLLKLN